MKCPSLQSCKLSRPTNQSGEGTIFVIADTCRENTDQKATNKKDQEQSEAFRFRETKYRIRSCSDFGFRHTLIWKAAGNSWLCICVVHKGYSLIRSKKTPLSLPPSILPHGQECQLDSRVECLCRCGPRQKRPQESSCLAKDFLLSRQNARASNHTLCWLAPNQCGSFKI